MVPAWLPRTAVETLHRPVPSVVRPPASPDDHRPFTLAEVTARWFPSCTTTVTLTIDDGFEPGVLVPSRSPTCIEPGWIVIVPSR